MSDSPSESTGNSTGKPPAWNTPRFTDSASPRRCTLQLTSSLQLLQMPMTGRPRNATSVTPVDLSHERCRNPSRSRRSNHSELRRRPLPRRPGTFLTTGNAGRPHGEGLSYDDFSHGLDTPPAGSSLRSSHAAESDVMATKAPLTYPRRGLHGEVVYTIGRRIVSGELKPGDPLPPEEELTADFDASRTVLREAVRVLAAKGLVEARPKTGTRVRRREEWNILDPDVLSWRVSASHDPQLYAEMTEVRLAIEPIAAHLAATRMTDDELAAVEEAYAAMEAAVGDQDAYLAADLRFHDHILVGCHNELLAHLGVVLRAVLQNTFELTTRPR